MQQIKHAFYFLLLLSSAGCSLLKTSPSYDLQDGSYKSRVQNVSEKSWVHFDDTIIFLYPFKNKKIADKNEPVIFSFNKIISDDVAPALKLSSLSFDVDVISIPFKFRPSVKSFPNQFNTNFSGAVYAGIRKDFYRFYYYDNPLGEKRRNIKHFGIGFGFFSGGGSSALNQWTTSNAISSEYDGFVFMNGFAGVVAVKNLTLGLGLGFDFLLDKNKKTWIYQRKPWLGLTVGLNLN